uniref:Uncharacterized protein n=1 Tax=Glossina palpalis gambiensis TaxID=67801 RepID=A0A1B0BLN1_9MUSC
MLKVVNAAGNTSVTVASKFKTISSSANGRDQRCLAFVGLIICGKCCSTIIVDLWSLLLLIIDSRDKVVPIRLSMAITFPSTKGFLKPARNVPPDELSASLLFKACSECQLISQLLQLKHSTLHVDKKKEK